MIRSLQVIPSSLLLTLLLFLLAVQPAQEYTFACNIPGCLLCTNAQCIKCDNALNFTSSPTTDNTCSCLPGYYFNNTKKQCNVCSALILDCFTCDFTMKTTTCNKCIDGSYLNGASCIKCQAGWVTCQNQSKCRDGSFLVKLPNNNICSSCSSVCLTCQNNFQNCTSCRQRQKYPTSPINPSFYLQKNLSGGNNTCLECMINNCIKCTNGSICKSCKEQYIFYLNRCVLCSSLIDNCKTCILKANNFECTECTQNAHITRSSTSMSFGSSGSSGASGEYDTIFTGSYLRFEHKCITKIQCKKKNNTLMNFIENGDQCQSCSDITKHCVRCRSATLCDQCQKGYYSFNSWDCLPCYPIILICADLYPNQTQIKNQTQKKTQDQKSIKNQSQNQGSTNNEQQNNKKEPDFEPESQSNGVLIVGVTISAILFAGGLVYCFLRRRRNQKKQLSMKFMDQLQLEYNSQRDTPKKNNGRNDEMHAKQLNSQYQ